MTKNSLNNSASEFQVSNLHLQGNTISSTDTNGNINITPDGSGVVSQVKSSAGSGVGYICKNSEGATGTSDSFYQTSSGGAGGGDAYFSAGVQSTRAYSWGVDNSDLDALKETTNPATFSDMTGTVLRKVTTSGEQTLPFQPRFLALMGAKGTTTGAGGVWTVQYDGEAFDIGGNFDHITTHAFTAPVTGTYHFMATLAVHEIQTANHFDFDLITSNRVYHSIAANLGVIKIAASNLLILHSDYVVDMDSADTAHMILSVDGQGAGTITCPATEANKFAAILIS